MARCAICCSSVKLIAQFVRRRVLDHVIAIGICALMLFFAVGSKVAWYHSNERGARSIAATKVWQAKNVAADSDQPGTGAILQTAVELIALLSLCFLVMVLPSERERSGYRLPTENFAALAVRPPPSFWMAT